MPGGIKVLIAEDSAMMRRVLNSILSKEPTFELIGAARDGEDLLDKARILQPDVITLDINMPRMDGLTALEIIMQEEIAPVIMVSSLTKAGADITIQALEMGAFDCVAKPGGTVSTNMSSVAGELINKIKAAARSGTLQRIAGRQSVGDSVRKNVRRKGPAKKSSAAKASRVHAPPATGKDKAVAIGISTGGPKTIFNVLPMLPANFPAPVFLVQHLPPNFTAAFAARINRGCPMRCVEARSGMTVEPGTIYLGQGGRQINIVRTSNDKVVIRTPSRPEHIFMPSVDVMMESVLNVYGANTIGVLMTGMGNDGADAMAKIVKANGYTVAESEESAVVWGMPGSAVERGGAKIVLPSWKIADEIVKAVMS